MFQSIESMQKTLAYQYLRRKDNIAELTPYDRAGLEFTIRNHYSRIADVVEFISDADALSKYGIDLNDYNQTFDFFRRWHLLISTDNNNSPLLPGQINLLFRAWHDTVHFENSFAFDLVGEYGTYKLQSEGLPLVLRQVLFSEIVMQAAYALEFGVFPEKQKVVLMPELYMHSAANTMSPFYRPLTA